jgi:maltose alpha-D-glucosyltransferase/alpha-amylase
MLRSFHYAAYRTLFAELGPHSENPSFQEPWMLFWYAWVSGAYLRSYLEAVGPATILPQDDGQLRVLLETFLLEKALSELRYELNNRPQWTHVAVIGILRALESGA